MLITRPLSDGFAAYTLSLLLKIHSKCLGIFLLFLEIIALELIFLPCSIMCRNNEIQERLIFLLKGLRKKIFQTCFALFGKDLYSF